MNMPTWRELIAASGLPRAEARGLAGERQLKKALNVSLVANGGGDVAGALLLRRDG